MPLIMQPRTITQDSRRHIASIILGVRKSVILSDIPSTLFLLQNSLADDDDDDDDHDDDDDDDGGGGLGLARDLWKCRMAVPFFSKHKKVTSHTTLRH
jgi:hypothetical protein